MEASGAAYQAFAAKADFDRLEFGWNMIGPVARIMPPTAPLRATHRYPAAIRRTILAAYGGCFILDRLIPRGGIDITTIARVE